MQKIISFFIGQVLFLGGILGQETLSKSIVAYQKSKIVYNQLLKQLGGGRSLAPELWVVDSKHKIIFYRKADNKLFLEKKAYEICAEFGSQRDAALAFLLGHELTHWKQEKEWGKNAFLPSQEFWVASKHNENEADVYGLLLASWAGYDSSQILAKLLERLYEVYNLESDLVGYPSLKNRKEVSKYTKKRARDLLFLYDNLALLSLLGKHKIAISGYSYFFQFLENDVLNYNCGIAYLRQALEVSSFQFPLKTSSQKLFKLKVNGKKQTDYILSKAKQYLEKVSVTNHYIDAQIGLSIIAFLQKKMDKALEILDDIPKSNIGQEQMAIQAILKGLIYSERYFPKVGLNYLEAARKYWEGEIIGYFVDINRQVLLNELRVSQNQDAKREDYIDALGKGTLKGLVDVEATIFGDYSMNLYESKHSQLLYFVGEGLSFFLQIVRQKNYKTKKGAIVGSSLSTVQQLYRGSSFRFCLATEGSWLLFPNKQLFFKLNKQQIVEYWGVYWDK